MDRLFWNILTVFLYGILYIHTAITVFLCILATYLAPRTVFFWIAKVWAKGLFLIIGTRLRVTGWENIPSSKKIMILTNHASIFDIPAIVSIFSDISWLGREYLMRIPIMGHMLKRANFIPVGKNPAMSVRLIIQRAILNSEKLRIALFPEGTRTTTGELQEFKRGFVHIMNGGDLDILPVVMNGLFEIKPKTRFHIRPFKTVDIIICKPIKRSALIELSNEEIIRQVKDVFLSHYSFEKEKAN